MAAVETEKPKPQPGKVQDKAPETPKEGDAATTLSEQATKPGDQQALRVAGQKGTTVPKEFGSGPAIEGTQPSVTQKPVPRLAEEALQKKAEELHQALARTKLFGLMNDPDFEATKRILGPVMHKDDIARLEKIYQEKYKTALREDVKQKLGEHEFRSVEALLNRDGARTNDAGNLMAALAHAKTNKDHGNAEVRQVLLTLSSKDLQRLDADFRKAYGKGYLDALNESKDLTPATREALKILTTGSDNWQKNKDAVKQLAEIAVNHGDRRLFAEALKFETPESAQARKELLANPDFRKKLEQRFPSDLVMQEPYVAPHLPFEQRVDQVALDYLTEGRISLKTITEQNTGKWFLSNKENIELAARNASAAERADFTRGRELALSGQKPKDFTEQKQLEYYNKIHEAFKRGGSEREVAIWEDQLINGRETIVSQMAKTHGDGYGPWGWWSGHNKNDLISRAENLSEEDWKLLRDEKKGPAFRKQIEDSLKIYADEGERAKIMQILDAKKNEKEYKDTGKHHRNLDETIKDNTGSVFLGMGTSYNTKNILEKISSMTPADADQYKRNAQFKQGLDKFVNENLNATEKIYAQRLLRQVEATGQPPKPDAVDKLLAASVNGSKPDEVLKEAEQALKDPKLRERLKQPDDKLSPEDRAVKLVVENAVFQHMYSEGGWPPDAGPPPQRMLDMYTRPLLESGNLPVALKISLGFDKKDVIKGVVDANEQERAEAMKRLSPDERKIVEAALSNPDRKMSVVDRMRLFAIGSDKDYQQFHQELKDMPFEERQKLRGEYARKYGSDLDNDFLSKVEGKDRLEYKQLIAPAEGDGRQTFHERFQQVLKSEAGMSADGSRLTMQKANDQFANGLAEYQRIYQTLPPEKQQALDKYFGDAIDQYKQSKEKLAELMADAIITAGALAATPFTGGASLALVIPLAAAGGAVLRPLVMKAIEGNDFDGSIDNLAKQAGIGSFTAALNFIGAEAFMGAGQLAKVAGGKLTAEAMTVAGADVLSVAGRKTMQEGLERVTTKFAGKIGKEMTEKEAAALQKELAEVVAKSAPDASPAVRAQMVKSIEQKFTKVVAEEQAQIAAQLAERTKAQIVKDYGKNVAISGGVGGASNAAAEIAISTMRGEKVDWNNVLASTLVGVGAGTLVGAVLHAPGLTKDIKVNLRKENITEQVMENGVPVTRTREGLVIRANDQTGDLRIRRGDQEIVLKPGDGKQHVLKPGDEIIDGPQAPKTGDGNRVEQRVLTPAEHQKFVVSKPPSETALQQTNDFAKSHELKGPVEDGFTYGGANRTFDATGKPTWGDSPSFVVDKQELAPIIAEAKQKFAHLPPGERAKELAEFVRAKFNPPGMSPEEVNQWYLKFLDEHPGERVTLGRFLAEGKGVCAQEAVLLKVLGDELGLPTTLVRGNGINRGNDINHVWTTIDTGNGPRVYDPKQRLYDADPASLPSHRAGSDIAKETGGQIDLNRRVGESVTYQDTPDWKIDRYNDDGTVTIRRRGEESVKPGKDLQEFQHLNADKIARDKGLKVGEEYRVVVDGKEQTWRLDAINRDGTLKISNERAHMQTVPREALTSFRPELGTGNDLTPVKPHLDRLERRLSGMPEPQRKELLEALRKELVTASPEDFTRLSQQLRDFAAATDFNQRLPLVQDILSKKAQVPAINLKVALSTEISVDQLKLYRGLVDDYAKIDAVVPTGQRATVRDVIGKHLDDYADVASQPGQLSNQFARTANQSDNIRDAIRGFQSNPNLHPDIAEDVGRLLEAGKDANIRIAFSQIMGPGVKPESVRLYRNLTEQTKKIDGPAGPKSGAVYEYDASVSFQRALAENGGKHLEQGWVFVPSAHNSAADGMGIDGMILNVKTGKMVPVDFADSPATLLKKQADGKDMWALHVLRGDLSNPAKVQEVLDQWINNKPMRSMIDRDGNTVVHARGPGRPPQFDQSQFRTPGEVGGDPSLPELPGFRRTLTNKEITRPATRTTADEVENFADDLEAIINSGKITDPTQLAAYRHLLDRARNSLLQRQVENQLADNLLPSIGHAIDVRAARADGLNPGGPQPNVKNVRVGSEPYQKNGIWHDRHYIEFDRLNASGIQEPLTLNGSNGGTRTVEKFRVYDDGRLVGITKGNEEIELGTVREVMEGAKAHASAPNKDKVSSGTKEFDFTSGDTKKILQDNPSLRILGEAIQDAQAAQNASTLSRTLRDTFDQVQAAAKTNSDIAGLTRDQQAALAKDVLKVREQLGAGISIDDVYRIRALQEAVPEVGSATEALALLQKLPPNWTKEQVSELLNVQKILKMAPGMDESIARQLHTNLEALEVPESQWPLMAEMLKAHKPGQANSFDEAFLLAHEIVTEAENAGRKLTIQDARLAYTKAGENMRQYHMQRNAAVRTALGLK
ncbi:MAG TPA: hypothetical protein V6D17_04945 [Candidatus Obscuribacterales bacterium]